MMILLLFVYLIHVDIALTIERRLSGENQVQRDANHSKECHNRLEFNQTFVDVTTLGENISVDTKYASPDNFLKEPMWGYPLGRNLCLVHKKIADSLLRAGMIISKIYSSIYPNSYGKVTLHFYDCYRPKRASQFMVFKAYDLNHKDWLGEYIHGRCVQEEESGKACLIAEAYSGHNTGNAVDLTIAVDGKPLDMGSNFDEFTHRSHLYYYMHLIEYVRCKQKGLSMEECIEMIRKMRKEQGLTTDQKGSLFYDHIKCFYREFAGRAFSNDEIEQFKIFHQNRTILNHVMKDVGLSPYIYEWWHYYDTSQKYEVYWDCLNTLFF